MTSSTHEPLSIAFLADAVFEDLPGGSRAVARELAHGLVERGHNVTFIVAAQNGKQSGPSEIEGGTGGGRIRIVRYSGAHKPRDFVSHGRATAASLVRETPFDIVHTHFAYAAVGPLKAFPRGTPHVRTFHGPWDSEAWVEDLAKGDSPARRALATVKRAGRNWVERANLRSSNRVVVLSKYFRKEIEERFRVASDRIDLIPGGVDMDRFRPPANKQEARRRLGWDTGKKVILSVRRLAPRMGLDLLIRSMPAVVSRYPDALLFVGGSGPEKERLSILIEEIGMGEHVRLLGFIPDRDLAAHYQAADLFVLPTVALEGFGLVTLEALSSGLPVIGSAVGATPEILGPLSSDLLVDPVNPKNLSSAIVRFFATDLNRQLTADRLRKYVEDNYSWDRHVEGTLQVYRQALQAAHR